MSKPRIATTSLCGCFGCHMSLLDIDERILALAELVEFDKSPSGIAPRWGESPRCATWSPWKSA
jgi:coenzyme F420-reducing hydrogenase gamma subunit